MSGSAPPIKKSKFDASARAKPKYFKNAAKNFLEVGCRGFLATTNFREKECVRDCYNLLNRYADRLYGEEQVDYAEDENQPENSADQPSSIEAGGEVEGNNRTSAPKVSNEEAEAEEEDIATTLANDIKSAKIVKRRRFNMVATGATNCVFIKTVLRDPVRLAAHIMRDVEATGDNFTRNVLRFVPVEAVCKANVVDIKNAAGRLFDKHFLNVPATTYSVVYNKRCNNDLDRDEIIRELAKMVDAKNPEHKVNLKTAQVAVLVEIVKGLCCLSVVPDYMQLKKYNLAELVAVKQKPTQDAKTGTEEAVAVTVAAEEVADKAEEVNQ